MRRVISALAASVLALTVLTPVAAAANGDDDMAEHPIVGTWIVESSPEDPTNSPELAIFGPGGTILNVGDDLTWAGSWMATGDRTIEGTFASLINDPEAGYGGMLVVRLDVEVAEDGQSLSGDFTVQLPAALVAATGAPAGELGPATVTAERMNVEPMGETVGPWPLPPPPSE